MSILPKNILTVGGRAPRFSATGHTKMQSLAGVAWGSVMGFYNFGKPPGVTDAETKLVGMRNRVAGKPNAASDAFFPFEEATYFDDYWQFGGDAPLLLSLPQKATMTMMFLARVPTAHKALLGTAGAEPNTFYRATLGGGYGNTINRGFGIEIYSTTNIRAVAYEDVDTPAFVTNVCGVTAGEFDKWRIWRGRVSNVELELDNITADGIVNNPTPTAMSNGHSIGTQTIAIGARYAAGSVAQLPNLTPIDIGCAMICEAAYSVDVEAEQVAMFRRQIVLKTTIVEGQV